MREHKSTSRHELCAFIFLLHKIFVFFIAQRAATNSVHTYTTLVWGLESGLGFSVCVCVSERERERQKETEGERERERGEREGGGGVGG
jgi:hypothetical protein